MKRLVITINGRPKLDFMPSSSCVVDMQLQVPVSD